MPACQRLALRFMIRPVPQSSLQTRAKKGLVLCINSSTAIASMSICCKERWRRALCDYCHLTTAEARSSAVEGEALGMVLPEANTFSSGAPISSNSPMTGPWQTLATQETVNSRKVCCCRSTSWERVIMQQISFVLSTQSFS